MDIDGSATLLHRGWCRAEESYAGRVVGRLDSDRSGASERWQLSERGRREMCAVGRGIYLGRRRLLVLDERPPCSSCASAPRWQSPVLRTRVRLLRHHHLRTFFKIPRPVIRSIIDGIATCWPWLARAPRCC